MGREGPIGHAMEPNAGHADAEPLVVTGLMRPDRHLQNFATVAVGLARSERSVGSGSLRPKAGVAPDVKTPVDRIDPNVRIQERSRRPQGMAVRHELASKRPTPADCLNRADLAAAVEELHKAQSRLIEPATTSHSPTA